MGTKNQDGWNSRYSDERFNGEQGCQGENASPTEIEVEIVFNHPVGTYTTAPTTYPNDMVLSGAKIVMTELFTAGTTFTVGRAGSLASLIPDTDFDVVAGALTQWLNLGTLANPDRTWTTAVATVPEIIIASVINGGGAVAGHGRLYLYFTR